MPTTSGITLVADGVVGAEVALDGVATVVSGIGSDEEVVVKLVSGTVKVEPNVFGVWERSELGVAALMMAPNATTATKTPVMINFVLCVHCLFDQTRARPAGQQHNSDRMTTAAFSYHLLAD